MVRSNWRMLLASKAFHAAARLSLRRFEKRLRHAASCNEQVLIDVLRRNRDTLFGRERAFDRILSAPDAMATFQSRVPLSTYTDLKPYVARLQAGETDVLSADPVHMLAGSSGTTDVPKRIPRTRRAQRHHLSLVVLAEQAVIDRGIAGAGNRRLGVNLMSVHAPPSPEPSAVPVMAGPNSGMARLRRQAPYLWCSPVPVYEVADPVASLYLHALFALRYPDVLYIQTPFAPQLVGWFTLMQQRRASLANDLRQGTIAADLDLTAEERAALAPYLVPDPVRAEVFAQASASGFQGIVPRLWPGLRYLRTVTSGTFNLSLPRLRWLAGPELPIHSGCHSSSEGVIGINLKTDGSTDYVLAVGTSFFEFIPLARADDSQPATVNLPDLQIGQEYEIVLTSDAGLYRYRLGDVIRITGWHGTAPTFRYLYRRGTLLNLVGEKTSEFHTGSAVTWALRRWLGIEDPVRDYTVTGGVGSGVGHYVFYVELSEPLISAAGLQQATGLLDEYLGDVNPYYRSSGRLPERLSPPVLKIVRSGTFSALRDLQMRRAAPVTASQIKTPRLVSAPEQIALLEERVLAEWPPQNEQPGPRRPMKPVGFP